MENKIATTVEQSKKLLELGIDQSTADMSYCNNALDKDNYRLSLVPVEESIELIDDYCPNIKKELDIVPAWSLSALLSLLPIFVSKEKGYPYFLEWQFWNDNSFRYVNPYSNERKCLVDIYSDHDEKRKDYIDTVFEMIVYLKENKLI